LNIKLKLATEKDCDLLFKWANDIEVRKNAFNIDKIEYKEHLEWFNNKINSEYCYIFILVNKDVLLGQIRLEVNGEVGVIGYSIDKKYRGQGWGVKLLHLLEEQIREKRIDINKLIGKVKHNNISSQKVFEKNNYKKTVTEKCIIYSKRINLLR